MNFDALLEKFTNTVDLPLFFLNLLVAVLLSLALRFYYIHFGQAVANRIKFAANFLPLALGTFLIITIIKSSIALSLGLVGALSIVRFRAAIKEPEELIFLFLIIGVGLATGANFPILAVVAMASILAVMLLHHFLVRQTVYQRQNTLYVNIHTESDDITPFVAVLDKQMQYVELKRLDSSKNTLDATFICKAANLEALTSAQKALLALGNNTSVSIVDQPDLIA